MILLPVLAYRLNECSTLVAAVWGLVFDQSAKFSTVNSTLTVSGPLESTTSRDFLGGRNQNWNYSPAVEMQVKFLSSYKG